MFLRPLILCSAMLIMFSAAWSMPVLQPVGSLESPPAISWTAWGEQTYGLTAIDARLVRWSRPEAHRDQIIHSWPTPPSGLEAWGDEILIQFYGDDGRLYDRSGGDQTSYTSVPDYWHLPNTEINGDPFRVIVEPTSYLAITSAPGPSNILSLLSFEGMGNIIRWDFDGALAVVANEERLFIVNMDDPLFPYIQAMITPPVETWMAEDLELQGDILAVNWGNRIQVYGVTSTATPELLDEASTGDSFLSLGDGWLASWNHGAYPVTIWDLQDPTAISVRGSFSAALDMDRFEDIRFDGDHCMWSTRTGIMRYIIPAGAGPIDEMGPAWPVIEARTMATAHGAAYLQGQHDRIIIDLTGPRLADVQPDVASHYSNVLLPVGDILYHNIVSEGLYIESLADPLSPEEIAEIGAPIHPRHADVSDDLLALAAGDGLVLYDVEDPETPVRLGELELPGISSKVQLIDQSAVVITDHEDSESRVHVIDVTNVDFPTLVTSVMVDLEGSGNNPAPWLVRRGSHVLVMCLEYIWEGPPDAYTLDVDLSDPATPLFTYSDIDNGFWCYGPGTNGLQVQDTLPVQIGDYHISFSMETVNVYRTLSGPVDLELVSTWATTSGDPVEIIAVDGNLLLVVNGHRLDLLTLSDDGLVAVPEATQAMSVQAAPNPFNPLTDIKFSMARAGQAEVDIIDTRGRRLNSLRAELPQGPASLRWDGTDLQGRAAPSGTYLLRVVTPSGTAVGRCQLVR